MKIKAKATKILCIRYAKKNLEYCFIDGRETCYTFNKQEIYDYILNELKEYEQKGIVKILYPKQIQGAKDTQNIQNIQEPKTKSKSKKKEA